MNVIKLICVAVTAVTAKVPQQINLEKGVTVDVVFGIKDIDRSNVSSGHVLSDKVRLRSISSVICNLC